MKGGLKEEELKDVQALGEEIAKIMDSPLGKGNSRIQSATLIDLLMYLAHQLNMLPNTFSKLCDEMKEVYEEICGSQIPKED